MQLSSLCPYMLYTDAAMDWLFIFLPLPIHMLNHNPQSDMLRWDLWEVIKS